MRKFDPTLEQEKLNEWKFFYDVQGIEELIFEGETASGLTIDDYRTLNKQWDAWLDELDQECPIQQRTEIILDGLRKHWQWEEKKTKESMEEYQRSKDNDEEYQKRCLLREQIEIVEGLRKETQRKGLAIKQGKMPYALSLKWIDPMWADNIAEVGIEEFIKKFWFMAVV